jgi:integrase
MRVPMLPALEAAIQIALGARRKPKKKRPDSLGAVEQIRRYLFEAKQHRPLTESGFKSCWGRMMRAAVADETITKEQRFHFHDIRAKHASDRDDDLAQLALGHTTPGMTKVYVRNPKGRKYPGLDSPAAGDGKKEDSVK